MTSQLTLTLLLNICIRVKTQWDSWFYSHLGHHSAGGISRHPAWHLPQAFACYLLPTINFPFLLQRLMTKFNFFDNREDRWGESMRDLWGSLSICPLLHHVDLPYHTGREATFHKLLQDLGRHPETPQWHGLPFSEGRRCLRGWGLWCSPGVDQSAPGLGIHNGRGLRDSIHLHVQWIWLAVCPYPVIWGCQSCTPPKGQTSQHLTPGKGRGPLWADQPTWSLPALICQTLSCLSIGFEWGQPVSHRWFTRWTP